MRVFIAVDVEEPLLVSRLSRLIDAVASTGVPLKAVEPENLHITIRFIGEVPEGLAGEIAREVIGRLEFPEFEVELRGLGAFPGPYRPRVVWVGVSEGAEWLSKIRGQVEEGLRRLGVPPERGGKEFHPHVTLARVKGSRNIQALARLIAEYGDYTVGRMRVASVRLKKSTLTPRGPIYETLAEARARSP
ncbi:MAG: RNA 2',3'-cyclic phosphodiesterase [Desulfurococcales archaeon]|nr:RNA 2',3'-cyclic phosphodiesterase [Desulfurococcales archaeon]